MILSQKLLENAIQPNQDGSPGIILDLSLKQIISIKGIEKYLEPNEVEKLLLSTNYLDSIDQNFHLFNNVRELDLSINHISSIENLESLQNLKFLNLSNNRIAKIEKLEALQNLEVLDLSMNYIERIENLKNRALKTLILSGNNIREIENLHHLKQLQNLEMEKNAIENVNNLTIFGLKNLRKIVFAYNKIPLDYFDDLLLLLEAIPTLEEINFLGNEIILYKLYKPKIMQFSNIRVLDKLALNDPIKKHFEAMRQDHEVNSLMEQTKKEYLDRMQKENEVKAATIEMIEKQKQRVEEMFDEHMKTLEEDLKCFFERAHDLKQKRQNGLDEITTEDILNNWREKIKKSAFEKKHAYDEAQKKQKLLEREYLEAELTSKKFTQKLYEIAMKRPEIWKDIKLRERDQYIDEEEQINKAKMLNPNGDESELLHYQNLANQIQANMIKDVANAVIDYEAKELHDQREKAATVLKHALLKQMVNHYTAFKKDNNADVGQGNDQDDEEDDEISEKDKQRMKFDDTDEQLKKMLYSKMYKDGQWKNQPKDGPRDLSNQSLQALLNIEPGRGKGLGSNNVPKKSSKKKKPVGHQMIDEQDEDHEISQDQRVGQKMLKNPNFDDDLERDPFADNGNTYYDDKHVFGEKNGEKIILIPFEDDNNTNVLDGLSTINGAKQRGGALTKKPVQDLPKPKPKKKKKKNDLQNVLADLEESDDYDQNKNKVMGIPDYQLVNRPYVTLEKADGKPQDKPLDNQDVQKPKKPKRDRTQVSPEEGFANQAAGLVGDPEEDKKKNPEPQPNNNEKPKKPEKTSFCNTF